MKSFPYRMIILFLFISRTMFAGDYGDAFMEFGSSTRGFAMARTSGAFCRDVTSSFRNPGGIAYLSKPEIAAVYLNVFGLADFHYLSASLPLSRRINTTISWMHFGVNLYERPDYFIESDLSLEERRDKIISLGGKGFGKFNDNENAFFFSFARLYRFNPRMGWTYERFRLDLPIGVNLKLIYKNLAGEQARGIGADAGFRFDFHIEDFFDILSPGFFSVSFSFKDITGTNLYWTTRHQDYIPPGLDFGISMNQKIPFLKSTALVAAEKDYRYDHRFRLGIEWDFAGMVAFRAGSDRDNMYMGCGISMKLWGYLVKFDYAILPHPMGNAHRLGLIMRLP